MAASPPLWPLLLACAVAALLAWAATGLVIRALLRHRVLDEANARSSHAGAKPRGGGLAVIPILLLSWIAAAQWLAPPPAGFAAVLLGGAGLALVSWFDDLRDLHQAIRLAAQLGAVVLGLGFLPADALVFQGLLPLPIDRLLAGLAWLWFVNLYNFMDGIDGITGVETIAIGLGLALVAVLAGLGDALVVLPALAASTAAGFLIWNWQPSKVFLGDVGSIPLGYGLGWLLLVMATQGQWAAALILPAYYLADSTLTLLLRLARREPVWRAHRQHFYQRAVAAGRSHAQVSGAVAACNLLLVSQALIAAAGRPWLGLAGAALVVAAFLFRLAHQARPT